MILVHGSVAADGVLSWDEVCADAAYRPIHAYSRSSYEKAKKATNDAPDAMMHLPLDIDVLLLDGGEFHSYGEYRALGSRAKVICLDDSFSAIKNRRVREELLVDDSFVVVLDKPKERNGWCIFCRREYLDVVKPVLMSAVKG